MTSLTPDGQVSHGDFARLEERVRELERVRSVIELLGRYAHLADAMRYDELIDLFAGDGSLELIGLSSNEGPPRSVHYQGREGIRRFISEGIGRLSTSALARSLHLSALNAQPEIHADDTATVDTYMVTVQGPSADGTPSAFVGLSRNTWTLVLKGQEWKILHCRRQRVGEARR